jgi:serine/threonine-protein kinase
LLERAVTVKLIHPHLADDPVFASAFADEARRTAALSAPGVARLLDSGEDGGVTFLVRERVEGRSARALVRDGALAPAEAVRIVLGTIEALEPAHDAGILHLALDLDDVLVSDAGDVRVTDLGLGAAVTRARPPADAAALLGGERAPEQGASGEVDARTDVFAIGAVAFELLTGQPPAGRRSPRAVRPGVPRAVDRAIARALAPDPDERPGDLRELAAALRASTGAAEAMRPRGWVRGWLGVPLLIAIVAAAAIAVGLWIGRLEVGGPLGIRAAGDEPPAETPRPSPELLHPVAVTILDPPPGDGAENDSTAPFAIDGDPATAWRSENYFDAELHKPGIGVVFDLGATRTLTGFRLRVPTAGYTFHLAVGDDPEALIAAVGPAIVASTETRGELLGSGRYVLVWITSVVATGDGSRAEIAEFTAVIEPA